MGMEPVAALSKIIPPSPTHQLDRAAGRGCLSASSGKYSRRCYDVSLCRLQDEIHLGYFGGVDVGEQDGHLCLGVGIGVKLENSVGTGLYGVNLAGPGERAFLDV